MFGVSLDRQPPGSRGEQGELVLGVGENRHQAERVDIPGQALAQSATLITVMNRSGPGTSVVGAGVNSGWWITVGGPYLEDRTFPAF